MAAREDMVAAPSSPIEQRIMDSLCRPLLRFIPRSVHPNTISVVTHLIVWLTAVVAVVIRPPAARAARRRARLGRLRHARLDDRRQPRRHARAQHRPVQQARRDDGSLARFHHRAAGAVRRDDGARDADLGDLPSSTSWRRWSTRASSCSITTPASSSIPSPRPAWKRSSVCRSVTSAWPACSTSSIARSRGSTSRSRRIAFFGIYIELRCNWFYYVRLGKLMRYHFAVRRDVRRLRRAVPAARDRPVRVRARDRVRVVPHLRHVRAVHAGAPAVTTATTSASGSGSPRCTRALRAAGCRRAACRIALTAVLPYLACIYMVARNLIDFSRHYRELKPKTAAA